GTITPDSPMIPIITSFIRAGITVCLVTAAGYANAPGKYEHRLRGLLDAFQFAVNMGAPSDAFQRHFYVMGGEANYLHRLVVSRKGRLQLAVVPGEEWKNGRGVRWSLEGIRSLLDIAEDTLRERAAALGLAVQFIRKERAVGMIRAGDAKFPFEVLEEVALAVQAALKGHPVPHCAFNGGQDCWVDVGNKALGIRAVQAFLSPKANASNTVHVGDRFTRTGNDTHSRDAASTLWISNPRETRFFLHLLLRAVVRTHPKVAAVTAEAVAPIAPIKPPGTAAAAMSAGVSGWVSQGDDTPVTSGAADLPQHAAAALGVSTRPRTPEQGDTAEAVRRPYTPDVLPAQEGDHVSPLVQAVAAPPPGTMAPLALPVAAPSASRVRSALDADGGVVVGAEAGRAPPVGATRRLSLAGSGEGSDSDDDAEGGTSAVDLDMSWLE
ncbi:ISN1, partial [Symbiodinium sp. KB8]